MYSKFWSIIIFFFSFFIQNNLISKITAPYTSFVWSSCSTAIQVPQVKFERLSMLPMVSFKDI
jgi:hypothetical protein